MATIDIIGVNGGLKHSAVIEAGSIRRYELMKDDYVLLVFKTNERFAVRIGDHIDVENWGKFYITEIQQPTYNKSTGGYDYSLQFNAQYYKWKNKMYKFRPATNRNELSWSMTNTLANHLYMILQNLSFHGFKYNDQTSYNYAIDNTVSSATNNIYIQFDNCNILDALTKIAEAFDCEWWVVDNVIHFGKVENSNPPIDFEIGVNVESMECTKASAEYMTKLFAFGAANNLPRSYRNSDTDVVLNGVVQRRLMLPTSTPYVVVNGTKNEDEEVEGVVIFEDIYPRTKCKVDGVDYSDRDEDVTDEYGQTTTQTIRYYRFKDSGFQFKEEYLLAGSQLQVQFQTGNLSGMFFDVVFNPDGAKESTAAGQWFELTPNETYGLKLPNETLNPKVGDEYILLGWDTSLMEQDGLFLIADAEEELLERTKQYAEKLTIDPSTYPCHMMSDYMYGLDEDGKQDSEYSKVRTFPLGNRVNLINSTYFESGNRLSRIIGYEYKLDIPYDDAIIIVGESATYSTKRDTAAQLNSLSESINFNGNTYTKIGSGSSIYLITSNDTTVPTEKNAYSAMRTDKDFLHGNQPDIAYEQIEFKKGLTTDDDVDVDGNVNVTGNINSEGDINAININATEVHSSGNTDVAGTLKTDSIDSHTPRIDIKVQTGVDFNETTKHRNGLMTGSFVTDMVDSGAWIDEHGNIEAESIRARSFFSAPEFRFNRVAVSDGESWSVNGLGLIEDVEVNVSDATKGIITLHLDNGEWSSVRKGDICRGIFNALGSGQTEPMTAGFVIEGGTEIPVTYNPNAHIDYDGQMDSCGFMLRYGFFTSYFTILNILEKEAGKCVFEYQLRKQGTPHPCKHMKFACYGSFTDSSRQSSSYENTHPRWYHVTYLGVNDWAVKPENISLLMGSLKGFTIKQRGGNDITFTHDSDRGIYVDRNFYYGGSLTKIDPLMYEDLQEELGQYSVELDTNADTITVDPLGTVVEGLYTVNGDNRKYKLHTSVTVKKGDKILTLAKPGEDADKGTFTMSVYGGDCTYKIINGTIYITGIKNLLDGRSETHEQIDYDAMRAMTRVEMTVVVSCEGRGSIKKNLCIAVNHISTSYINADLDNENASVAYITNTNAYNGLPYTVNLSLWHDGTKLVPESISLYKRVSGSSPVALVLNTDYRLGTSSGSLNGDITFLQAVGSKLSNGVNEIEVRTQVTYAGILYERTVVHTITKTADANIYELIPSVTIIRAYELNGESFEPDEVGVQARCTDTSGNIYMMAEQDLITRNMNITYQRYEEGGVPYDINEVDYEEQSGPVEIIEDIKSVVFRLYLNNNKIDEETVPVVFNGQNAPSYHVFSYVWSSTASGNTEPSGRASAWMSYIPSRPNGYDYLWVKDQYYEIGLNGYNLISTTYTRMNGEDGTGIELSGTIPSSVTTNFISWLNTNVSNPFEGECWVSDFNGYLFVYIGGSWRQSAEIKGADGVSQFVHIAWCNTIGTGTDWTSQNTDFAVTNDKVSGKIYKYFGILLNTDSGADPDVTHAGEYTWSEVLGENAVEYRLAPTLQSLSFGWDSDDSEYTPNTQSFSCGYEKIDGDSRTVYPGDVLANLSKPTAPFNMMWYILMKNGDKLPSGYWWMNGNIPSSWTRNSVELSDGVMTVYGNSDIASIEIFLTSVSRAVDVADSNIVARTSIVVNRDGEKGDDGQGTFKSTCFIRCNNTPSTPTGGSYASPVPTSTHTESGQTLNWSDGIPQGDKKLWATTRIFTDDGEAPQQSVWTTPRQMTDTETYDVEFAVMQTSDGIPATPTTNNRHKTAYPYGYNGQVWFDPEQDKYSASGVLRDFTSMYWRAERVCLNGVWGDWIIVRIKGEKGDDGASPFFVDLSNEMDSVACSNSLKTLRAFDIYSQVKAVLGITDVTQNCQIKYTKKPTNCSVYLDTSNSGTSTANPVTTSYQTIGSRVFLRLHYNANVVVPERDTLELSVYHQTYGTCSLILTINGLKGSVIYNLIPNVNVVNKSEQGTFTPSSVTCLCNKIDITSGETSVNPSESIIKYTKDGSNTEYNYSSALVAGTDFSSIVTFLLYVNGVVVDRENVSIVKDGLTGEHGLNCATVALYKRWTSSSTPSKPWGNIKYKFSTDVLEPQSGGSLNGWVQNVPAPDANGNPCWRIQAVVKSTTDEAIISEWSEQRIFVKDGDSGSSGAVMRMRGAWNNTDDYECSDEFIDVVYYIESNVLRYYSCKVTHTHNNAHDPSQDTTHNYWNPFDMRGNVATELLISEQGYSKIFGAGKLWIGELANSQNGWLIEGGMIRHTGTGLTLTKDGSLLLANGDFTLSANHIYANGLRIDEYGNLVINGAINNGELRINSTNRSNFLYASGNDNYLDVMRCPSTVIFEGSSMPNNIVLPFAYYDRANSSMVKGGGTQLPVFHNEQPTGDWYQINYSDLRSIVGRKIRIYWGEGLNPEGGITSAILVLRNFSMDLVPADFDPSWNRRFTPDQTLELYSKPGEWYGIHSTSDGNAFIEAECKIGLWNGVECIYWEITESNTIIPD